MSDTIQKVAVTVMSDRTDTVLKQLVWVKTREKVID